MKLRHYFVALAVLLAALLLFASAQAQSGGGYELTWSTLDGGGAMVSAGGGYTLGGTAGQPDAGALTGGEYSLTGGFWAGAAALFKTYLPLVVR